MRFVRTRPYLRDLKRLGVTVEEANAIEETIAANPAAGDVVKGLEGVRKVRFAMGARGKSGGGRAIYLMVLDEGAVLLLTAYAKNEKADLDPKDRKAIRTMIKELRDDR